MIKLEHANKPFPFELKSIRGLAGIYCLTNKINGKKYIGKSNDLIERLNRYSSSPKTKHNKWGRAIKKYTFWNFDLEILEAYTHEHLNYFLKLDELVLKEQKQKTSKFLCEREAYWIAFFDATNDEKGYNICHRSTDNFGAVLNEEQRKAMSEARKGEKNHFFGRKQPPELKRKIDQIDLKTGEVIKTWDSVYEARKALNMKSRDSIHCVLRGAQKKAYGFGWRNHEL